MGEEMVTDSPALSFSANPRALIRSISRGIACCSAAFFMPAKNEPVCGRLTSSFLAEALRPTPVSRERSTAVSPAGPRSEGSSRKQSTAVSPFNPRAKGASRKRSTALPATEPRSTSMIAEPVAVIPLACGRHPSLPLVASDPRVWPGRCSVASALSARITPRNLVTSAEIAALVSASLRFLDNVLLVGALHLRSLRTRAVQRWIQ